MLYFNVHVKTDDTYKDIAEDVETKFDTSSFELGSPLPRGKSKKVIELMKDELGQKIMKKNVGLRAKAYSYLKESFDEDKKEKRAKKVSSKKRLKFEDYKNCLDAAQIENKI